MSLSRRRFLQRTAIGGAVVASGVGVVSGCGNDVLAAPIVHASVEEDITDNTSFGTVRLDLRVVSDLVAVGGAVTVQLAPPTTPADQRTFVMPDPANLLVIHRGQIGEPDEYIAVASSCPHAGCPLGYSEVQDKIMCPCHSSVFRAVADPANPASCVGEVLHAPARQGPTPYECALDPLDPSTLVVDLRIVDSCGTVRLPALVGKTLSIPIAQFPMLAATGGAIVGRPKGSSNALAIVRLSDASDATAFAALSATCTHLGCTVAYGADGESTSCGTIPAGGGFWCACHCSQFALDGSVRVGPASKPLPKYGVAFDGTTLTITLT